MQISVYKYVNTRIYRASVLQGDKGTKVKYIMKSFDRIMDCKKTNDRWIMRF